MVTLYLMQTGHCLILETFKALKIRPVMVVCKYTIMNQGRHCFPTVLGAMEAEVQEMIWELEIILIQKGTRIGHSHRIVVNMISKL